MNTIFGPFAIDSWSLFHESLAIENHKGVSGNMTMQCRQKQRRDSDTI